jgi:hypothetical protein
MDELRRIARNAMRQCMLRGFALPGIRQNIAQQKMQRWQTGIQRQCLFHPGLRLSPLSRFPQPSGLAIQKVHFPLLAIRVGQQGFDQSRQHGLMGRLFAVNGWERIEPAFESY